MSCGWVATLMAIGYNRRMNDPLGPKNRIRANRRHAHSAVRDEGVVLLLDTGEYFALNAVGVRVWQLLQEERSFAELVAVLISEYDVSQERAERDLAAVLQELSFHCLVENRDDA